MKSSVAGTTPTISAKTGDISAGGRVGDINSYNTINNVYSRNPEKHRVELANWVSDLDFSSLHVQALGKRTPGTLEWLIASPQLKKWRNHRGRFLWCPGPPGAGKTVFASYVIDLLQKTYYQDHSSVSAVCYIYCQYSKKHSVRELFEVLLKQLILLCPSVEIDTIQKMKDQGRRLPLDEITALLQSSFSRFPGVFVVVDALDECFSERDRQHLLQKMRAFLDVNILMTSRDLPHIAEFMQCVARLDILAVEGDVNIHLDLQRQRNLGFAKLAAKLSGPDLTTQVVAKAGHSFLLADLHILYLSDQTNVNELKRALDNLPTNAAASHGTAIGRIDQQSERDKHLAYTVLSLVSYAFRPFKLLELRHAAANMRLDRVAEDDDLVDEERIVSVCAGLITVNQRSAEVGFIHYTVQEYLQQIRQKSGFISEAEITKSLMRLIRSPRAHIHTLLNYAASSWPHHVRRCEEDESVTEMALSLLADTSCVGILYSGWDRIYRRYGTASYACSERDPYPHRDPYPQRGITLGHRTPLHLVAAFGLTQTGKLFLQQYPERVDQPDEKGRTPLSWASGEGHSDTVLMLLEAGNVRMLPFKTIPPMRVLMKIQNKMVRQKVQVNQKDQNNRAPLSYAAQKGHLEVIKVLINTGNVDINVKDGDGRTPISLAAENGHLEVVKLFVDTGKVNINIKDEHGGTPIFYAVEERHLEVVKALLGARKVEIDMKAGYGRTLLSHAAWFGCVAVVKLLLDTGKVVFNVWNW